MTLTGRQKAALLLTSLDANVAADLLKGVDEHVVKDLAVEMAYLDVAGLCDDSSTAELAREFCDSVRQSRQQGVGKFLDKMLKTSLGNEKALDIQNQISGLLHQKDPFIPIRKADNKVLAAILNQEHPQASAVILEELEPKRSSEIMTMLGDDLRLNVIGRMTGAGGISTDAKKRIAMMVSQRLTESDTDSPAAVSTDDSEDKSRRKVAVMLRNLSKDLRDGLIASMNDTDPQQCKAVTDLMIIWEDIIQIEDRSLQEGLRGVDAQKMALAFIKADQAIVDKIKANISERATAAIEEEASLMSSPKKEDVDEAREHIVSVLRQMNTKGELTFIE